MQTHLRQGLSVSRMHLFSPGAQWRVCAQRNTGVRRNAWGQSGRVSLSKSLPTPVVCFFLRKIFYDPSGPANRLKNRIQTIA